MLDATAPAQALAHVRVVELANLVAGPTAGMLLADYGADVVKVEQPELGDGIRTWGNNKNGVGLYHKVLNRNKRCITADLRKPLGVEIVRRLVRSADVVIESFRPGTLEKWGLGYETLRESNPGLVLVRVSGFGQTGPYSNRSGFGSLAEAMTGFAATNGYPDRPPLLPSFPLADTTTGLAAAFLTLAALESRRANGGRGQVVDLAVYEPLLMLLGPQIPDYSQLGVVQERAGSRLPLVSPRNTFRTHDGKWIALSAGAHAVFQRLCSALGVPELATDARFVDNQLRRRNDADMDKALREVIASFTQAELVERFRLHDAPGAPVYSVEDVVCDPHFQARKNLVEIADEQLGDVLMPNVVGKLSDTPGQIHHAGPELGASNRQVLIDELAFTEQELAAGGLHL